MGETPRKTIARRHIIEAMNPSFAALFLCALVSAGASRSEAFGDEDPRQLTRLSIEELANLKVVTVSRRIEGNMLAPGSVHLVTTEDIRRTGSISIPDALRTSPGVQASRIDGDEWALAIRGFASRLSRSVLAMVDGRSVWTPLFAGVFWDVQDTLLEDVEQMEVSRGPGGAVYGANALNGVINVTTKSAEETQGGLVSLSAGTADRIAGLRWGGAKGENTHYRVFGKYSLRDGTKATSATGYEDEWKLGLGGFRLDSAWGEKNTITVLGNLHNGRSFQPASVTSFTPPYSSIVTGDAEFRGHNLLGRIRRQRPKSSITVQTYYDHTMRNEPSYEEERDTFDLDIQHQFQWRERHSLIWGAAARRSTGVFLGPPTLQLIPSKRSDDVVGFFANDEVGLFANRLRLSVGTKVEWNDYSGWNAQPGGRVAWLQGRQILWGSWVRALRTSSRIERDVRIYSSLSPSLPLFARAQGSPDFKPESVVAIEAGYKLRTTRVLLTAAVFRNAYRDLGTNVTGAPFVESGSGSEPARTVIPVRITNGPEGRASGFEGKLLFKATRTWRLQGSYSLLNLSLLGEAGKTFKSNSPQHQFWLTSFLTPAEQIDVDLVFRRVGAIEGHQIKSFSDLDARVAYRVRPSAEVSVAGSNLLHATRPEFGGGFAVERSVRFQATLHF
jgi:iron complex outermembrane receptor protein